MIIEEIKKDINFIKEHTLQPAWWKITKIFVLLGSLISPGLIPRSLLRNGIMNA